MGAATPPLPRRGVPFGCFATFIEKSAHPEFLEVRRSDLIPAANNTPLTQRRGNGTQEAQEAQEVCSLLVPLVLLVFRSLFFPYFKIQPQSVPSGAFSLE